MMPGGQGIEGPRDLHDRVAALERNCRTIEGELERYSPELAGKPRSVVLSKIDLLPQEARGELIEGLSRALGVPVRTISAVSGEGIGDLLLELESRLREMKAGG